MQVQGWTGFYAGANAGYGIGRNPSTASFPGFFGNPIPPVESFIQAPNGALGGFQAGYDVQFGAMVLGIEGDWQWSTQKTNSCVFVCDAEVAVNATQRLRSFGTLRGRLGIASGSSLLYATGGLAVAHVENDLRLNRSLMGLTDAASFRHSRVGWTAGAGIETVIGGNWTAKVEYLYADFGKTTDGFDAPDDPFAPIRVQVTSELHEHIVRAGINYRFNSPGTATSLSALRVAPDNWAGAYIGGNLGYGIGHNPSRLGTEIGFPIFTPEAITLSPAGITGGAQAGHNWQTGHLVIGVEGDFQGANQKDAVCLQACKVQFDYVTAQQSLSWFGTVRGRIGYAAGPALLYATGGYAVAGIKTDVQKLDGAMTTAASLNEIRSGWVLGGGIETMFAPNWSTKLEYIYADYGSVSNSFVSAAPFSTILNSELHNHVVRAGVNYHFGG